MPKEGIATEELQKKEDTLMAEQAAVTEELNKMISYVKNLRPSKQIATSEKLDRLRKTVESVTKGRDMEECTDTDEKFTAVLETSTDELDRLRKTIEELDEKEGKLISELVTIGEELTRRENIKKAARAQKKIKEDEARFRDSNITIDDLIKRIHVLEDKIGLIIKERNRLGDTFDEHTDTKEKLTAATENPTEELLMVCERIDELDEEHDILQAEMVTICRELFSRRGDKDKEMLRYFK